MALSVYIFHFLDLGDEEKGSWNVLREDGVSVDFFFSVAGGEDVVGFVPSPSLRRLGCACLSEHQPEKAEPCSGADTAVEKQSGRVGEA